MRLLPSGRRSHLTPALFPGLKEGASSRTARTWMEVRQPPPGQGLQPAGQETREGWGAAHGAGGGGGHEAQPPHLSASPQEAAHLCFSALTNNGREMKTTLV